MFLACTIKQDSLERTGEYMVKMLSVSGKITSGEIRTEILRKSIHMMIAIVPTIARYNLSLTLMILASGVVFYTYTEMLRVQGVAVGFVGRVTEAASRKRDRNGFVLGPVTLGLGAMLALMLYPEPAAAIAIYALAFGDGLSGLFGKLFGRVQIPFTGGKTFAGSSACLISVFIISYGVSGSAVVAAILSLVATFLEALPSKDFDNLILPVGTGFAAVIAMGL